MALGQKPARRVFFGKREEIFSLPSLDFQFVGCGLFTSLNLGKKSYQSDVSHEFSSHQSSEKCLLSCTARVQRGFCSDHRRLGKKIVILDTLWRQFKIISQRRLIQTAAQRLTARRNHYEILGIATDCTQKDIKNAFVARSKECHPDTNMKNASGVSDTDSSQEFIKVMEAYQVLSKAHSRANYDQSLRGIHSVNYVTRDTMHEPWKVDPTSYTDSGPNYPPYYGVKGIKRMKNWKIVCACIIFCATGVLIQVLAITKSVTFKREQLDKFSAINSSKHETARNLALKNGNDGQIDLLKLRMVKSEIHFDKDEV